VALTSKISSIRLEETVILYLRNIRDNFRYAEDHVIGGSILHDLSIETGL
jgi:hypothetical protein